MILIGISVIVSAYHKGFLRSIISVIGYIASIFVAIYLSKYISAFIYNTFIRENIIKSVQNVLLTNPQAGNIDNAVNQFLSELPSLFEKSVLVYFNGKQGVIDSIANSSKEITTNLGIVVADNIVGPIIIGLLQTISCIVIFIICTFIVKIVSRMFGGFSNVPVLGTINSILGAIIGIAQAGVWLFVLAIIGKMIISFTGNSLTYFNLDVINQSYLFKMFYQLKFI